MQLDVKPTQKEIGCELPATGEAQGTVRLEESKVGRDHFQEGEQVAVQPNGMQEQREDDEESKYRLPLPHMRLIPSACVSLGHN